MDGTGKENLDDVTKVQKDKCCIFPSLVDFRIEFLIICVSFVISIEERT